MRRHLTAVRIGIVCVLATLHAPWALAAPDRLVAPEPWVDVAPLPAPGPAAPSGETDYLLADQQVRVAGDSQYYARFVQRLHNAEQVADASQISLDFTPGVDEIIVHAVAVVRGAQRIDQWPLARRSVLQRETGLEEGIIDGAQTLHLILQDVRIGDIIDYSYTRRSRLALTGGRYSGMFRTRWNANVARARLRLLHTAAHPMRYLLHNETLQPTSRPWQGTGREWLWEWNRLTPVAGVAREPDWYNPASMVQFSEFPTWNALATWAAPFYRTPATLSAPLTDLVRSLADAPDDEVRILRALRFVQDEIRYTGIEIGDGAYVPRPPDQVLARRFGDCKDKVLLFVTLLRAMNIEAAPALVNTRWPLGRDSRLPAPDVFNHVVARVRSSGSTYWLDPTNALQGGDLARIDQARFSAALVLDQNTQALEPMPVSTPAAPLVVTRESFNLRAGPESRATLTVRTEYRGVEADAKRDELQRSSRQELTKSYLDYYATRYPSVTSRAPVQFEDDRDGNIVTITESYELPEPYGREGARTIFDLAMPGVQDYLPAAPEASRAHPLALLHPLHVRHESEVLFAEDWNLDPEGSQIRAPGFDYSTAWVYRQNRLFVTNEFKTTADHVAVKDLAQFRERRAAVADEMAYTITQPSRESSPSWSNLNPWYVGVAAIALGLGVGGSRRLALRVPPQRPPAPSDSPRGFGGWFVLVWISVAIAPLVSLSALVNTWPYIHQDLFVEIGTQALAAPGAAAWLKPLALTFVAAEWLLLPLVVTTFVLMIRYRPTFPAAFLWSTWLGVLSGVFAFALEQLSATEATPITFYDARYLLQGLVFGTLWSLYVLKSRRVQATFTRTDSARSTDGLIQPLPQ